MKNTIETLENYLDHALAELTHLAAQNTVAGHVTKQPDFLVRQGLWFENTPKKELTNALTIEVRSWASDKISISAHYDQNGVYSKNINIGSDYYHDWDKLNDVVRAFAPTLDELIQEFKTKYKL